MNKYVLQVFRDTLGMKSEHRRFRQEIESISSTLRGPTLPNHDESAVIAVKCPMTAALCFDRVWGTPLAGIPDDVAFMGCTETEVKVIASVRLLGVLARDFNEGQLSREEFLDYIRLSAQSWSGQQWIEKDWNSTTLKTEIFRDFFSRHTCSALYDKFGIHVSPVFDATEDRDLQYKAGQHGVLVTTLDKLQVVDESRLDWQQVSDFRRDFVSQEKYRRLIHWFDKDMVGASQSFIIQEVSLRLDDYESALKKHGIRTRLGVLSGFLDGRFLAGPTAVAGAVNVFLGDPVASALAAGFALAGGVYCHLRKASLDLDDVKREHADIAFVHMIKGRFSN